MFKCVSSKISKIDSSFCNGVGKFIKNFQLVTDNQTTGREYKDVLASVLNEGNLLFLNRHFRLFLCTISVKPRQILLDVMQVALSDPLDSPLGH